MAPGRRRGGERLKSTSDLSLGDLVLAKVKGFPAWPAKVSRPEEWGKTPDPRKYFVYFFGTAEIAFVVPADIQAFTVDVKNKLLGRCKGKPLRFTQAVKEICEEFEKLQQKNLNGSEDDTSRDVLGSEDGSIDADEDDSMEVDMKDANKSHLQLGKKSLDGSLSLLERCSQKPGTIDGEERKPSTSGIVNGSVSPGIYGKQGTCKTDGPISLKKEVVSTSSSCSDYLSKEEGCRSIKVEADVTPMREPNGASHTKEERGVPPSMRSTNVRLADTEQKEPIKGNKPRQLTGTKRKSKDREMHHGSIPVILAAAAHESSVFVQKPSSLSLSTGDGVQTETSFDDSKKSSQIVDSSSKRKAETFLKGKNAEMTKNAETEYKDVKKAEFSRKKMNVQEGQLKQASWNNEVPRAAKGSNSLVTNDATANMSTPTQTNKKVESNSVKDVKNSVWNGKMENHSTALGLSVEDALPPPKRSCHAVEITEGRVKKKIAAPRFESSSVDSVRSFSVATKRRAVRICDDEEDEAPKTPIHAGSAKKVSCTADTAEKDDAHRGSSTSVHVTKKRLRVEDGSANELSSAERPVEDAYASSQKNIEKKLIRKTGGKSGSSTPKRLVPDKISVKGGKPAPSSPKVSPASVPTSRPMPGIEKPNKGDIAKLPNCDSQKKSPTSQDLVSGAEGPVVDASASSQTNIEKKLRKTGGKSGSLTPKRLVTDKTPVKDGKAVLSSPKVSPSFVSTSRPMPGIEKPSKGYTSKLPDSDSQKKPPTSQDIVSGVGESSHTSLHKQMGERTKHILISEVKKTTPKSSSIGTDAVLESGCVSGNGSVTGKRPEVSTADKISYLDDSKISDRDTSMKHLIAAAQAKRRQAHLQNHDSNVVFTTVTHVEAAKSSPSSVSPVPPLGFSSIVQPDTLGLQAHSISPPSDVRRLSTTFQPETEQSEENKIESGNWLTGSSLSGGTDAAVSRDAFEGMIETLSRTKESIGRATRLAIDCAKYGIATEVIELLIRKLQSENSMHRKVDLFFLVDSITQCSHNHKGIAGASYIPTVQAALSRLLGAAAPPGATARENRRQCLKVLRLWQERKILPETFLQPFMEELGVVNDETSSGLSLRRPSRVDRAFDDPIREMEGMLVDEYGSNSTFQLAGFFSTHAFGDNEDDDEIMPTNFYKEVSERSSGEHTPVSIDAENQAVTPNERRHCILEDVDGELEMEDVSISLKDETEDVSIPLKDESRSYAFATTDYAASEIYLETPSNDSEFPPLPYGSPPLPPNSPPQTPPLPSSPPPLLPQLPRTVPPPPPSLLQANPFPPLSVFPYSGLLLQPLQPQPSLAPQCFQPFLPSISSSPLVYQHQPSTNQGNQLKIAPTASHGLHGDLPGKNDAYGQFPCNTSRPMEYSQIDAYGTSQSSQPTQQLQLSFSQTPLHPNAPPQNQPNHLAYPYASAQQLYPHPQHLYPQSFSLPNRPDGPRLYVTDDQWRARSLESWMPRGRSSSGAPFAHEGFRVPLPERPPTSTSSFQPPRPHTLPASAPVSGHAMSGQADMHAHNWKPP